MKTDLLLWYDSSYKPFSIDLLFFQVVGRGLLKKCPSNKNFHSKGISLDFRCFHIVNFIFGIVTLVAHLLCILFGTILEQFWNNFCLLNDVFFYNSEITFCIVFQCIANSLWATNGRIYKTNSFSWSIICMSAKSKLYIPSTLNIDLILRHTQLNVCA